MYYAYLSRRPRGLLGAWLGCSASKSLLLFWVRPQGPGDDRAPGEGEDGGCVTGRGKGRVLLSQVPSRLLLSADELVRTCTKLPRRLG